MERFLAPACGDGPGGVGAGIAGTSAPMGLGSGVVEGVGSVGSVGVGGGLISCVGADATGVLGVGGKTGSDTTGGVGEALEAAGASLAGAGDKPSLASGDDAGEGDTGVELSIGEFGCVGSIECHSVY